MADRQIQVGMQATYRSNLKKELRKDQRRVEAMRRWAKRHPVELDLKLNVTGITGQVAAARKQILGEFAKVEMPGILGADGKPMQTAARELNKAAGLLSTTRIFEGESELPKTIRQVEQLGDGLQRIREWKRDADSGDMKLASVTEKDIGTVKELDRQLKAARDKQSDIIANAKARKDAPTQVSALQAEAKEVEAILSKAREGGLLGSRGFEKGEDRLTAIRDKIAGLEGGKVTAEQKKARDEMTRSAANAITQQERRVQEQVKANKLAMDQAERLGDVAQREAEINRLYGERRKIFEDSRDFFRNADEQYQRQGRPDLADRAMRRTEGMNNLANQVDLDRARRETDLLRERSKILEKLDMRAENKVITGRAKAEAAEVQERAKIIDDLGKQEEKVRQEARKREEAEEAARRAAAKKKTGEDLRRELADRQVLLSKELELAKKDERLAKAQAKTADDRAKAAQDASQARSKIRGRAAGDFQGIEQRALAAGFADTALSARNARGRVEVATIREMEMAEKAATRFADAKRKGGHALNFHSNQLLRNAATFAKWYGPMQAVMGVITAFNAGLRESIRVDRQFATLQAVFRGTAEEAQRLKEDTLALAVAQGRSTEEAMDAAVRWSRLGLTRVQVNRAVETSLVAANVAEIKASEAAEKLSAIYATYSLSVEDLPVVLNRLNAISNRYNVTNKDLLEGIVRVAGVAKQAGLELRDLEGIIGAVTGATGRPGQEVGNALKFVITRITDPKTVEKLKDTFDLDLNKPNGDLKDFADILALLAAEFPKLNTAQKQQFLAMTAGSRQAARFALILDQYRQSQILAAEAAFDSASAWEENEKILSSLQSRIDSLQASWTKLFTAVGDAGGFEVLGQMARYMQEIVQSMQQGIDTSQRARRTIAISDPQLARMVQNFGGGEDPSFRVRDSFSEEEVGKTLEKIRELYEQRDSFVEKLRGIGGSWTGARRMLSDDGLDSVGFSSWEEVAATMERLQNLTETGQGSGVEDRISAMTREVNVLRERLSGLGTSEQVFRSLADEIEAGATPREKLIRDFENGAHLLMNLDGGAKRFGQSIAEFNAMIDAGDYDGAAGLAREIAALFQGEVAGTTGSFERSQREALAGMREEMATLYQEKERLLAQPAASSDAGLKEQADALDDVQAKIKATASAIESLNKSSQDFSEKIFSAAAENRITDYLDTIGELAKKVAEFAESGDAEDPVDRVFQRRRRAMGMELELLRQVAAATEKEAAGRRPGLEVGRDRGRIRFESLGDRSVMDDFDRQLRQQEAAVQYARTRVNLAQDDLEKKMLLIDAEEQLAMLERTRSEAAKRANASAAAAAIGITDTDRTINQTSYLLDRAQQALIQSANLGMGSGRAEDTANKAGRAGSVLADEAMVRKNLDDLERRSYELAADRKNLELEILDAAKRQNEEASKRLQMASREDQLRAAALSRSIRDRGGIRENEFFAFSQGTRQAISSYLPGQVPASANDSRQESDRRRRELDDQIARVNGSLDNLVVKFSDVSRVISEQLRPGGALDAVPNAPRGSVQDAAASRDRTPIVRLDVGSVDVRVQIADQIEGLMRGWVEQTMRAEAVRLEAMIRQRPQPTAQGVTE